MEAYKVRRNLLIKQVVISVLLVAAYIFLYQLYPQIDQDSQAGYFIFTGMLTVGTAKELSYLRYCLNKYREARDEDNSIR